MNTRNVNLDPVKRRSAFTLIEMLVVIAIIGILAGLAVGVGPVVIAAKNRSRAKADLAKIQTIIEAYKAEMGQYPPDNINPPNGVGVITNKAVNTLFYELLGTSYDAAVPSWKTLDGVHDLTYGALTNYIGMSGILNASDRSNKAKNFFGDLKSSQHAGFVHPLAAAKGITSPIQVLIGPGEGDPASMLTDSAGRQVNAWYYNSSTPIHNKQSFDLWITIRVGNNQYETIGNW